MGINKEFGHRIGRDGYLQFPEINEESIKKAEEETNKVKEELKIFLESCKFSQERISELQKLKKDMEDLKKLERIDRKQKMLIFLDEKSEEICKYKKELKIKSK